MPYIGRSYRRIPITKRKATVRYRAAARRYNRYRSAPTLSNLPYMRLGGRTARIAIKGQEKNFVDTGQLTLACDTTGSVTLVNTIAQGVTVNQRIGKKALLKSCQVRGFFQPNSAAVYNNAVVLLVYDAMSNGAAIPAVTDIMTTANSNDFLNNNNTQRFWILKRWSTVIAGTTSATGPPNELPSADIDEFVKLEREIEWNTSAATGVQATIQKGALYLVSLGSAAAGTTAASFICFVRTRFTEDY